MNIKVIKLLFLTFILFIPFKSFGNEPILNEFIKSSNTGNQIEFFWSKPAAPGIYPLLVLIHPHQDWPDKIGGEFFVQNNTIDYWTKNNFVVVAISQPGYGQSEGPSDFCGNQTQNAVQEVILHFKSLPFVNKNKIFLYGGSRGAVVAALLSTKNNYSGIVLKSGLFDLENAFDQHPWYSFIKINMIWELGFNAREKLKERSSIFLTDKIKTPLLIIHGKNDDRASFDMAKKFTEIVKLNGTSVEFIEMDTGHIIPMNKVNPFMESFFNKIISL